MWSLLPVSYNGMAVKMEFMQDFHMVNSLTVQKSSRIAY